jgi:DNA-binding transcriptional LysR family regulator
MQLNQLRYFISVAENLNFTEAAKQLYVAQSAVSQQIAYLETELGLKLFIRNKRSVQLTNAGVVFLKEAKEIVSKSEKAMEKARMAGDGLIGNLKIGFLIGPTRDFLPSIIREFNTKYPQIAVELSHDNFSQLREKINRDDLDICIGLSLGFQDMDHLEKLYLFPQSTCVYMHHEHPLAHKGSVDLTDLSSDSFVMRERAEAPQWYDYSIGLCVKNGFFPKIATHAQRIETIMMFVDSKMGVAILPEYLNMYASSSIRRKYISSEKDTLDIYAYYKKSNLNPAIPLFLDQMELFIPNK